MESKIILSLQNMEKNEEFHGETFLLSAIRSIVQYGLMQKKYSKECVNVQL